MTSVDHRLASAPSPSPPEPERRHDAEEKAKPFVDPVPGASQESFLRGRRRRQVVPPELKALEALRHDLIDLKCYAWEFATAYAEVSFVGGVPALIDRRRATLREVAKAVEEGAARLTDGPLREQVAALATQALEICDLEPIPAITATVRLQELFVAAEGALRHWVDNWCP